MMFLILTTLFVFGAIIASFVGVIVARLNTGEGFLTGRSRCDACSAPLSLFSLIPVFSYIVSGGRARCCSARFSLGGPVSELLLGSLFVLTYLQVGLTDALTPALVALSVLLALVLYDISHQILPPAPLLVFVTASAIAGFFASPTRADFVQSLLIALGIATFLALIHFASRGRAMGLADSPFAFGLALLVGQPAFTGFVFSFWIGAVIGIVLLLRRPVGSRMGVEVPFAPYLAAGFLLAYFTQWNLIAFITGSP